MLGHTPRFISAAGRDAQGDKILRCMLQNKLSTESIQRNEYQTGIVEVSIVDDEPQYQILPNQAFDHIDFRQLSTATTNPAILYHGSLCWRNSVSRQTLIKLRDSISVPVFVDLNIRQPWFDAEWLPEILSGITILKLNKDELKTIADLEFASKAKSIEDAAIAIRQKYKINQLWVTSGSAGAWLFSEDDSFSFEPAPTVERFVDAVGAGDAFSSFVINGFLKGMTAEETLKQAVRFAAKICQIQGATSEDRAVY